MKYRLFEASLMPRRSACISLGKCSCPLRLGVKSSDSRDKLSGCGTGVEGTSLCGTSVSVVQNQGRISEDLRDGCASAGIREFKDLAWCRIGGAPGFNHGLDTRVMIVFVMLYCLGWICRDFHVADFCGWR